MKKEATTEDKKANLDRKRMLSRKVRIDPFTKLGVEPLPNSPTKLYDIVPLKRVFRTSFDFGMTFDDKMKIYTRYDVEIETAIHYTIAWLFGGKICFEDTELKGHFFPHDPVMFGKNYDGIFDKEVLVCAVSCLPYLIADFFPELNTLTQQDINANNSKYAMHIRGLEYLQEFKDDFESLDIKWNKIPLLKDLFKSKRIKAKGGKQLYWWSHHDCFRYLAKILELSRHSYLGKLKSESKQHEIFVKFTKFFHKPINKRGAKTILDHAQKHLANAPSKALIKENRTNLNNRKEMPLPEFIEYFFKFHLHLLSFYDEQINLDFIEKQDFEKIDD